MRALLSWLARLLWRASSWDRPIEYRLTEKGLRYGRENRRIRA